MSKELADVKGVYAIVLEIERKKEIDIGVLGNVHFDEGIYVYAGSAMGSGSTSLENRLKRHFSDTKTIHWHIDYLVTKAKSIKAWYAESRVKMECELSQAMDQSDKFHVDQLGFGSSDCKKGCPTHLYRYSAQANIFTVLSNLFPELETGVTFDGILFRSKN